MGNSLEKLRGRLALVTGASSGIGLCFARELAAHGCNLILASNEKERLETVAGELAAAHGITALPLYVDLTAPNAVESICEFIDSKRLDPDILINNAGIFSFLPLTETPERKIDSFIDLHVRAVTALSREFARRMAGRHAGNILNMSSMSCWMPMPGLAMYAATKAYIRVFSRSLHYEMRDSGVRVTVAAPGGIATDLFGLPEPLKRLAVRIGALQTPEKFVRGALKCMLRGRAQYINGLTNRISIMLVGCLPTRIRMIVKHRMLDRNITHP